MSQFSEKMQYCQDNMRDYEYCFIMGQSAVEDAYADGEDTYPAETVNIVRVWPHDEDTCTDNYYDANGNFISSQTWNLTVYTMEPVYGKTFISESDGKHYNPLTDKEETVYCPVNGLDCPYYHDSICYISDPVEECDDFNSFFETWEEWEEEL